MGAALPEEPGQFGGWELVSRSWEVFSHQFGILFLGHFACFLIMQGAYTAVGIGGVILAGPIWYGLCHMSISAVRGGDVLFEQLFAGFQERFMALMLISVIMHLIALAGSVVVALLGFLVAISTGVGEVSLAAMQGEPLSTSLFMILVFGWSAFFVLLFIPAIVLIVLYAPAFFILIDEPKLEAWAAMEKSRKMVMGNWPRWRNLWVALSIIHLLGILACCVGYFIATPWMVVALGMAYERSRAPLAPPEPPPLSPTPPPVPRPGGSY